MSAMVLCVTFFQLCGLIYIIVGSLLKIRDGVFNTYTFPLLNQFVIHGMPLGDLSWGLVVALYFFLPLHTLFGFLGFFGAICRNKLLLIIVSVCPATAVVVPLRYDTINEQNSSFCFPVYLSGKPSVY